MTIVLNVAEKPSVARGIADALRGGQRLTNWESATKFNPVLVLEDFAYGPTGRCEMVFTSVRGHLMEIDYTTEFQDWNRHTPDELFSAQIVSKVNDKALERNLVKYGAGVDELILWLDCDREGEAICFEVIEIVCGPRRNKPRKISRAHFSSVTVAEVRHALANLQAPDRKQAEAVNARRELDLRIGASLTRLMTKGLIRKFQIDTTVLSYGPCQIPTLGFVVSRWIKIQRSTPHPFYYLIAEVSPPASTQPLPRTVAPGEGVVIFKSHLPNMFDKMAATLAYHEALKAEYAEITSVEKKPTSHRRPKPMNTLTFTKICSSHLKIPSFQAMQIAEKLYTKGFVSYPRTETEIFPESMDLKGLIRSLSGRGSSELSNYAQQLLDRQKFVQPDASGRSDQAHPPIHPVKVLTESEGATDRNEWRVYQLITKHFLACCSADALGETTTVTLSLFDKEATRGLVHEFGVSGLVVTEPNFLEIYKEFDSWKTSSLPSDMVFAPGQRANLTGVLMKIGETTPPRLLSEHELITLMDKHQIGTDATMHEHIRTITTRQYVERVDQNNLRPTLLGISIFLGLHNCCSELTKPQIRADMERAVLSIARGELDASACARDYIARYRDYYTAVAGHLGQIENVLSQWLTASR